MTRARIDEREQATSGASFAFGTTLGAHAPVTMREPARTVVSVATPTRSWWARGLRMARDAAIAVAVMTLVPVGLVAFRGERLSRAIVNNNINVSTRAAMAERTRPFRVPFDPSITPLQAGLALNALQPARHEVAGFESIEPTTRPVASWRETTLLSDTYLKASPDMYNGPSSRSVLEASVDGFDQREMDYLRMIAAAPVWREFDLVARAPAIDAIGGRFRIPFGAEATPERRPLPSFSGSKELAYAAVARAAYHMAIGEPEAAETVLRSIVSYGFAFIDNGTSGLEEYFGVVIVGIGRDALQRFYVIRRDPRASHPGLAAPDRALKASTSEVSPPMSATEARRRLLVRIEDPTVPLGERFDGLQSLSALSCTNMRELLVGPRADVREVRARARHTVARFPSERALIDLQSRLLAPTSDELSINLMQSIAVSSATVAGVVLLNPRLASCTRIITAS